MMAGRRYRLVQRRADAAEEWRDLKPRGDHLDVLWLCGPDRTGLAVGSVRGMRYRHTAVRGWHEPVPEEGREAMDFGRPLLRPEEEY